MNIRRIFPMEVNLILRNWKEFIVQKQYKIHRKDEKRICFFLDAATYGNLGDQAISLAMEYFLTDLFGKDYVRVINESDLIRYMESLKKQIRSEDIIVMSGGGNMGDLYPRYEALRRLVLRSFPDTNIVIFPQTIDYSDDAYGQRELARSQKIYRAHKKLFLCAREKRSYETMCSLYENVLLVPDIVLYLKHKLELKTTSAGKAGVCLRHDKESAVTKSTEDRIAEVFTQNHLAIHTMTTVVNNDPVSWNMDTRLNKVLSKIEEFRTCNCIFTDRLHGMIFSILAGRPCLIADNSNHKVLGVYEMVQEAGVGLHGIMDIDAEYDFAHILAMDSVEYEINCDKIYDALKCVLLESLK